jgi:hypothetical protein
VSPFTGRVNKASRDDTRKTQHRKIGPPQIESVTEVGINATRKLKDQQWLWLTAQSGTQAGSPVPPLPGHYFADSQKWLKTDCSQKTTFCGKALPMNVKLRLLIGVDPAVSEQ